MKLFVGLLLAFIIATNGRAADTSSLEGKIVCGYQGWFRAEGDGSGLGWVHFGAGKRFAPGSCTFDLWPDTSGFEVSERFPTPFVFEDGSTAELFSSIHPKTVRRHFQWMREYGIDGAFVQRFGTVIASPRERPSADQVLSNCIEAAIAEDRTLTVMYDLTNFPASGFSAIARDWRRILENGWAQNRCAQKHAGRPLVAVYGLGFAKQPAALEEWRTLLAELRASGCSIMLGIPTYWREAKGDALSDNAFHELLRDADILSPWTVGRMARIADVDHIAANVWKKDSEWCDKEGKGYVPVIFPGFSWHNLSKNRGEEAKLDAIPREGGRFLWKQALEAKRAGAKTLYVAMFDEIDEGTAVMKCSPKRPVGESPFVDLSDVPSDHYLWLCGQAGRMIRREIAEPDVLPLR
jgi:hypothetical protein